MRRSTHIVRKLFIRLAIHSNSLPESSFFNNKVISDEFLVFTRSFVNYQKNIQIKDDLTWSRKKFLRQRRTSQIIMPLFSHVHFQSLQAQCVKERIDIDKEEQNSFLIEKKNEKQQHTPVMVEDVVDCLDLRKGQVSFLFSSLKKGKSSVIRRHPTQTM